MMNQVGNVASLYIVDGALCDWHDGLVPASPSSPLLHTYRDVSGPHFQMPVFSSATVTLSCAAGNEKNGSMTQVWLVATVVATRPSQRSTARYVQSITKLGEVKPCATRPGVRRRRL